MTPSDRTLRYILDTVKTTGHLQDHTAEKHTGFTPEEIEDGARWLIGQHYIEDAVSPARSIEELDVAAQYSITNAGVMYRATLT